MPFAIALSGLNAASSDLNVTANNIANANTVGFKGSRAEFADVFAVGAQEIGNGTRLSAVTQEFARADREAVARDGHTHVAVEWAVDAAAEIRRCEELR